MSGPGGTSIFDPRGPLHGGGGDQHNYYWSSGAGEQLVRGGAARLEIVREHRLRLTQCYIRPRGYSRIARRLARPGSVVILDGAPGAGRRAAATMLLEETSVSSGRIEELPAVLEEGVPDDPSSDDRYLLDLSRVGEGDYTAAQRTLMRYRSLVEKCGARMVAVAPAGLEWMLDAELTSLTAIVERPRGRAVLSRHLRVRQVPFIYEQLATDEVGHLLATAPMRDLDRLADLVLQARVSARYGTDFTHWRDEAVAAATNWTRQVAGQLRDHRDVRERALLLAAAMTHGSAADTVLGAADGLLEMLRYPKDETPALAREGVGEQLERLSLIRDDDGRVRFARLAYDSAVRQHFWENFPELRQGFRDWAGRCMALPELGPDDRARLANRFAEQALASGRPEDLCVLAERWTEPAADGRLRAEAAAILELGLSHEQYGARFRVRVYEWVRAPRLTPDLARVLTDVCRHVVAVTHPEQALVRLRYLVLRLKPSETTAQAARSALLELARGNRRLYARLVNPLLQRKWPKDRCLGLLAELLEPAALKIEPPWLECTLAWSAVMVGTPPAVWTPVVRRWLALSAHGRLSGRGLGVLVIATSGDRELLDQLYATACEWAETRPPGAMRPGLGEDRRRIADAFCRDIDIALGIGDVPTGPDARTTRDGT
ncbi:hypothetical protein GA0115239_104828 [Streptomyces sp. BpilaLS-43]|uniref:hypothetical protein n=1 Tax=Streptomyces sp. BpilaLS-43 TaxID=1839778 RepID=UPI00081B5BF6|nr:hypothetical protein [Streptomyces sp. BpilaLS-43]SCD64076.1 hypothetical protein GA0115239_104828 [Streptomyces sp. BpilaLS-43]